jgi:hypothetical protein
VRPPGACGTTCLNRNSLALYDNTVASLLPAGSCACVAGIRAGARDFLRPAAAGGAAPGTGRHCSRHRRRSGGSSARPCPQVSPCPMPRPTRTWGSAKERGVRSGWRWVDTRQVNMGRKLGAGEPQPPRAATTTGSWLPCGGTLANARRWRCYSVAPVTRPAGGHLASRQGGT